MPSPFPGVRAFFARFAFPLWQLRLEPVPAVCFHRVTSIFNYLQLRLESLTLPFSSSSCINPVRRSHSLFPFWNSLRKAETQVSKTGDGSTRKVRFLLWKVWT